MLWRIDYVVHNIKLWLVCTVSQMHAIYLGYLVIYFYFGKGEHKNKLKLYSFLMKHLKC